MMNVINQASILRSSRQFPDDPDQLRVEIDKMYIETANAVNNSTSGVFPVNKQALTKESWFLAGNLRQETLRQVFQFTSTASITHNINVINPSQFTRCFGSYTNGTNSFGLFFATSVAIAGQITFYITSTQIVFVTGAGAPALTSGRIVLEWLSQP